MSEETQENVQVEQNTVTTSQHRNAIQYASNTQETTDRKPSHLRQRWKRKTSTHATIREDNGKQPKELKTVQIPTAERLNYRETSVRTNEGSSRKFSDPKGNRCGCQKDDRSHYASHENRNCRCHSQGANNNCVCKKLWAKTKTFFVKLLALEPSEEEKEESCESSRKISNHRPRRPYHNRRRPYHSNHPRSE